LLLGKSDLKNQNILFVETMDKERKREKNGGAGESGIDNGKGREGFNETKSNHEKLINTLGGKN